MQPDYDKMADAMVAGAKRYVDSLVKPLVERIRELETRPLVTPKDGVGIVDCLKDGDGILILTLTDGRVLKTNIRDGAPGENAAPITVDDVRPLVVEEARKAVGEVANEAKADVARIATQGVAEAVKALPKPGPVVIPDVAALVAEAVEAMPAPAAGKDVDMVVVRAMIMEAVKAAVEALPAPAAPELPDYKAIIIEAVNSLPPAAPGKDADMVAVAAMVEARVEAAVKSSIEALPAPALPELPDFRAIVDEAVKALPAAAPGKDADMDAIRAFIEEAVDKAVAALPEAKDGVGLAGAFITRGGTLTLTLTDGSTRDLGQVVGADADMAAIEAAIKTMVDAIPRPRNGVDAVGFDDMDLVLNEEGAFLNFARGEKVKSFRLPIVIDRGVFKEGSNYHKGDGVTWGGSFWIAQKDTKDKPDAGGDGWRLAVKKGRDGKDNDPVKR